MLPVIDPRTFEQVASRCPKLAQTMALVGKPIAGVLGAILPFASADAHSHMCVVKFADEVSFVNEGRDHSWRTHCHVVGTVHVVLGRHLDSLSIALKLHFLQELCVVCARIPSLGCIG